MFSPFSPRLRVPARIVLCVLFLQPTLRVSAAAQAMEKQTNLLRPGKVDLLFTHDTRMTTTNAFLWSPVIKGGVGITSTSGTSDTKYAGFFIRATLARHNSDELILGVHATESNRTRAGEVQGEYRVHNGLGIGGGFVERSHGDVDVAFGKMAYRGVSRTWHYIVEGQLQKIDKKVAPGGYIAVYTDISMVTIGSDGEQWRSALGYVAPLGPSPVRPAGEILYVDNSIGELAGPKFLFVNATLGYSRGFLSHPARLGRAMGPTGLEFGNPLAFLAPTWNRQLEVWELGSVADVRIMQLTLPNNTRTRTYEALVFPFSLDSQKSVADYLFVGAFYSKAALDTSRGAIIGAVGRLRFLQVAVSMRYDTNHGTQRFVVGLLDWLE